jgi:hypothetical protein
MDRNLLLGNLLDQFSNYTNGMRLPGNIDLNRRPVVRNPDGSISTVASTSIGTDQGEVLIPMVAADGSRVLSQEEAEEQFFKTRQHLGIFETPEQANAYAQSLHEQQDRQYAPKTTADILQAQEEESRRRLTHWPQAPNPYFKGAEDRVNRWWTGVVDRTGQWASGIANFPQEVGQLFDPQYMSAMKRPDFQQGLDLALTFIPGSPAKVAQAEAMAAKGATREEIWDKLLLYKGPDKKWRTEISDDKSRLNPKGWNDGQASLFSTPGAALKHDVLYKADPEIKEGVTLRNMRYGPGQKTEASYMPDYREISVQAESPQAMRSYLAHELQHDIQKRAGFATGGSPSEGIQDVLTESQRYIKQAQVLMAKEPNAPKLDELMEQVSTGKIDGPTFEREYEQLLKTFKHYDDIKRLNEAASAVMNSPAETYRRLAGEAEARNVQTRLSLTPEQRRATPPWKSLDVPEDELIVRYQQGLANALEQKPGTEFEQAHEIARQNAVKMLGLPENNTAMDRARAMGFGSDLYHYTPYDFREFKPHEWRGASFLSDVPEAAQRGAFSGSGEIQFAKTNPDHGGWVMPVRVRGSIYGESDAPDWFVPDVKTYGEFKDYISGRIPLPKAPIEGLNENQLKQLDAMRLDAMRREDSVSASVPESEWHKWPEVLNEKGVPDTPPDFPMKKGVVSTKNPRGSAPVDYQAFEGFGYDSWAHNPLVTREEYRDLLRKIGFDAVKVADESGHAIAVMNPTVIRSRFAAFDPAKKESNDLLASLLLGSVGLPLMMQAAQNPEQ